MSSVIHSYHLGLVITDIESLQIIESVHVFFVYTVKIRRVFSFSMLYFSDNSDTLLFLLVFSIMKIKRIKKKTSILEDIYYA